MWEERVDAGHVLRIAGAEFGLAILLLDRVEALDGDCAESVAIFRDSIAQDHVVAEIDECDQQDGGEQDAIDRSHRRDRRIVNWRTSAPFRIWFLHIFEHCC